MEFLYCHNPTAEVPVMLLLEDIGLDENGKGIDGARFLQELLSLEAMKPKSIEVWINSAGGVVADGYNIYSAILDSQTPVDTKCVGMAASIAAVIFEAGRRRIMNDYSWLMFHNPYGGEDRQLLNIMKGSIAKMVARSGKPEDEILDMMKRTTYIYADEAKQMGLCDTIEASDQKNKKRLSQFTTEPRAFHREVNLVINKLFDINEREMTTTKITAKLGLTPEASEDSIREAIDNIINKAQAEKTGLEGKIDDLQKKMDAAKTEYDGKCKAMEEEMDKLTKEKGALAKEKDSISKEKDGVVADKKKVEDELDKMKKEKEEAEDAMREEKARNKVEGYAQVGRIKNEKDVKDFWTAQMMADEAIAVKQIEALPLSKTAPVFDKIEPSAKITASSAMTRIRQKQLEDRKKSA